MSVNVGTLRGLLELRDEFTSVLKRATTQLQESATKMDQVGRRMSDIGGTLTRSVTLPIIAAGGAVVKLASDFESSFAGVRKTVDATEQQFAEMAQSLRDMSKEIPVNVNELNAVAEAAGQLGIAREDIVQFTRTMADLGNTTNLTAEEAATATAQFQNIFGAAGKDVDRFGSTLVALGNAGASTEKDIISMGLRIAGAGNQIGLTQGEVLAFASSLASVGIEAEAGGSAISKVMISMALAVQNGGRELKNFQSVAESALPAGKDFATVFKEDAAAAVTAFIAGLQNIDTAGGSVLKTLDEMGVTEIRMRDALLRAAGAGKLLTDSLNLQSKAWEDNSALAGEAEKRYQTFQSQLTLLWNRVKDVGITVGTSLLPVLRDMVDALEPILKMLASMAQKFSDLPKGMRTTILVMVGLAAAIGPVVYVVGNLITAFGSIVAVAPKVVAALGTINLAMVGIGAAAVGIALLINNIINKWREASEAAIKYSVVTSQITGRSFDFVKLIKASGGVVDKTIFEQAKQDLEGLDKRIEAQRAKIESLRKLMSLAPTSPLAIGLRFDAERELPEAQRHLQQLEQWYRRQAQALSEVTQVTGDVTAATVESADAMSNLAGDVNILTKEGAELANQLADLRGELARSAAQSKQLSGLFGRFASKEDIDKVKRAHALQNAYFEDLKTFGKAAADSLKGLRAAQFDAAKAAEDAEEEYTGVTDALEELDKITRDLMSSSGGMGDALKKALDINVTKLNDSVSVMLKFIDAISQIDEDLDFEVRLSALDDLSPHLREVEANFLNLLRNLGDGSVEKGEEIFAEMANALGISIDQIKAKLGELSNAQAALRFKGASLTSRDIFKAEKLEIERLVKAGALSVADGQAAINQSTQQFWSEQLNNWGSALDFLEQRFGSFFGYLNQAVSALQQAQGFGKSISGIAEGFGASAGTMAALGAIGTTLGIFAVIYDVVDKIIKKRKTQKFGTQLSFDLGDGSQTWDDQGNEIIKSIQGLIAGIEEALDISIDDLAEIGLKVRNDGEAFKLYFKGVLIDTYGSLDEALQEALRIAITDSSAVISGMSELMAEGLSSQRFSGFEDMMEFLSQLREISDLGASAGIIDLRGVIRNFDDLWKTLQRLRSATESVIQGYNNLVLSEINTWRSLIDSVTGRQPTEQELLEQRKQELAIIRTEIELRKAVIKQRILEIEATIAAIKAGNMLAGWPGGGGGNIGGGGGPGGGGLLGVAHAFAVAGAAIAQTGVVVLTAASVLTQEALDMIAALEAEADALRDLLAGLEGLVIPDPESLKPGRGGGGAGDRQSVRDFIDTRTLELALSVLGEYGRKVEEIRIQYDQLLLQAGKDISLRSQLIELRERELRILAQEQAARTVDNFRSFLGLINPFEQIRDTAADLIKEIEDSPFGDERKARMIGRVLAELDRQIEEMAREGAASLFGDMLGDLEAYGASEELMMQARQHMAILEHTLKMEHYRAQIAILKAQGTLAPEIIATLEESFRFLKSIDIRSIISSGDPAYPFDVNMRFKGYDNVIDATDRFGDELKRARDLLKKYQTDGLDPLTRNLQAIVADFRVIRDQLGDTQDVMTSYARAVNRALSDFLDPITSLQRDLFFGESSTADVLDKWQQIQIDLATALDQFRAGNLSVVEDIPGLINQFMSIAALVSPIGSEGFRGAENIAKAILHEVSLLSIEDVGDIAANPINVNGMADLEVLSEAQLDALNRIYDSSEGVAMAIDNLSNTILYSGGGLSNVA